LDASECRWAGIIRWDYGVVKRGWVGWVHGKGASTCTAIIYSSYESACPNNYINGWMASAKAMSMPAIEMGGVA